MLGLMKRSVFVKTAYWIAAAVDGFVALGMVFPKLLQPALRVAAVPSSVETRYALYVAASLMFGWTLLLIWGSAEPVARRTILLLTLAAIAGLALSTLYGYRNGYIPFGGAMSVWTMQAALTVLLGAAYGVSNRADNGGE